LFHQIYKFKGEITYILSSYLTPVVSLVTSVIATANINPIEIGKMQSILLIGPYFSFIHFGVFNGLNRNIAFYKGMGNLHKVQSQVNASKSVANFSSIIGLLFATIVLIWSLIIKQELIYILSALALLVNFVFNPQITHYDTTYRSGQDFLLLGKIKISENFISLTIGVLPYFIGYIGRIIYVILKPIYEWILRFLFQPIKANSTGKLNEIQELATVGFPLLLSGFVLQLFLISDQSIIATYLGPTELGYYTLSTLLLMGVSVIPQTLGIILYPKASELYGKFNNNKILKIFFWKALFLNIMILGPVCLTIWFMLNPITEWLLPKYIPGISAAKINILTCLTFISNGPSVIIGVVKKNIPIIFANSIALLLMWLIGTFMVKNYFVGIIEIAWLRLTIAILLSLTTLFYSYYLTTKNKFNS
jgi:O-antigen/teichoic acid export membrane protein